jgi:ribosome recycling factor
MLADVKKSTQDKMDKTSKALIEELKKIRTGKAQVSMLDSVKVNYYGSLSPLSQVASVSCPDAKSFLIAPWEPKLDVFAPTSISCLNNTSKMQPKPPKFTKFTN